MIYWCITFGWAILGTALFLWLVARSWEQNRRWSGADAFWQQQIRIANTYHPFGITDGYGNYKASIVRHMFAFLVSAVVIRYCAEIKWLVIAICGLNGVYAWAPFRRVRARIDSVIGNSCETQDFLIPMAQDGSLVSWYSAICVGVLFILILLA